LLRHREPIETSADAAPETDGRPWPEAEAEPEAGADGSVQGLPAAGFDWWRPPQGAHDRSSPAAERLDAGPRQPPLDPAAVPAPAPEPGLPQAAGSRAESGTGAAAAPAPGPVHGVHGPEAAPVAADPPGAAPPGPEPAGARDAHAEVYRHVHQGEQFQEIRRTYRGFVFPACAVFLLWYLGYIVAAVALPGLMARPVAGPFNVAWLLGLLQFATTFVITWLYARHARDRRDRAALGLRWETQDRLR
jgi:uncharacterized membrane protein (DUF485 family)